MAGSPGRRPYRLRPAEGKMRKTNPIPGLAGWGEGSLRKQTQFPAGAPWHGAAGACDEGQMRQTNPIFLRAKRTASVLGERIYGDLYLQGAWEKQTQFQAVSGTPPSPLGPPALPLGQRQLYKQSQFPAGQKEGQVLCAKRSQFGREFQVSSFKC
jgi:hypothetical protein